jgi:hypothetical protein
MLKRTTIYLEESEVETLRQISFIQNRSMADLIRQGVQELCQTFSHEQKDALSALAKISKQAQKNGLSEKQIADLAVTTQREVRRERKKSRR